MKKHFGGLLCVLLILSITIISWKSEKAKKLVLKTNKNTSTTISAKEFLDTYVDNVYEAARLQESGLALNVFEKAVTGFLNLKITNKLPQSSTMLTIIDFAKSSCQKRMWIINMATKELLLNTLVAHGSGSGDDIPTYFSDNNDSHASSLGFYVTDDVYMGKHGRSLRLDGMDDGFNASARMRSIVLHAAKYVSQRTIDKQGRLGHSFGCPAVSPRVVNQVIETIKNKNVLFISGNDDLYSSKYLDEDIAANFLTGNTPPSVIAGL